MFIEACTDPKTASFLGIVPPARHRRPQDGGPLLLMHEAGSGLQLAAEQAEQLSRSGYEVVAFEVTAPASDTTAAAVANRAAAAVHRLGMGPVTVVGIGTGATVALTLALGHPEVVGRIVTWEPGEIGSTRVTLKTVAARNFHPLDIGMIVGRAPSDVIAAAIGALVARIERTPRDLGAPRGASVTHLEEFTHNGVPDARRWAGWSSGRSY